MAFRDPCLTGLVVAVATTLLYGCTSMSDQQRTVAEGCVGGGIIGGGLCYLISDSKKREKCILAATGGCVAGGAVGYVISERKSQYATNEAVLDSEIERASALSRMAAERNRQTRLEISRLERENARLKTASASTRISRGVMERQKKDIGTQLQLSENTYNELIKEYESVIAIYEEQKKELASSDVRLLHLQREVNQLEINIRDVSDSIKKLQRLNESIS